MPFFSKTFSAETTSSYSLDTPCFRVKVEPFDKAAYLSVVEVAELESLMLALVFNASAMIERQMEDISDPDARHFALMHVVEGEMMLSTAQGTHVLKSGQYILADNSQPRKIFVYKSVKVLLAYISRTVLQRYISSPEEVLWQVLKVNVNAAGTSLFSPVLQLWEHLKEDKLSEFSAGISDQLLSDLGAAYARQNGGKLRSRHALRLRHLIKQYVERNLGNPTLITEAVAAEFKVSSRYIRSLFNGVERLPVYIQRRRIEEGANLLASSQHQALSITDIAHRCGFKSSSQFTRCFRSQFNETARDFRQRHMLRWEAPVSQHSAIAPVSEAHAERQLHTQETDVQHN